MTNLNRIESKVTLLLVLLLGSVSVASSDEDKSQGTKLENSTTLQPKSATKKSMPDILNSCSAREKLLSEKISQLMDQLSTAIKSGDQAIMADTLQETRDKLSSMKSDHEKCADSMKKLKERLEDLKKQVKAVRKEHEKAASIVEDEDMDDIIWAE